MAFMITAILYCAGYILILESLGRRPPKPPYPAETYPSLTLGQRALLQVVAVGMQLMVLLADTLLVGHVWKPPFMRKY